MRCLSGPGGPYAPPTSTLSRQHAGTSHAGLLMSEGLPTPTWGTHQGRAWHLSGILPPSTDIPISLACSLAIWDFRILPPY